MCIICEPVLGPTIDHSEKECPLMASAYCGICVCYGHFQADCPYKVGSVCDSVKPIKSTVPSSHANILYIPDREVVHRAYLSSHGQVIYGKITKNKAACETIAKLIGYTSASLLEGEHVVLRTRIAAAVSIDHAHHSQEDAD
jgi:hypothetical protein